MKKYLIEGTHEIERLAFQNKIDVYDLKTELASFNWKFDDKVLDAGCGSGNLAQELIQMGIHKIDGIDMSSERVAFARERFSSNQNVNIYKANLEATGLEKSSYDKIICRYVFEHVTEPIEIFSELISLIKDKGKIYIINFDDIFFGFYTKNHAFNKKLVHLKSKLPQDFEIARKIPQLLASLGLVDIKWNAETYFFKDQRLELEITNTKMRLEQGRSTLYKYFDSLSDYDKFCEEYLEEMKDPNNVLYASKFLISAEKSLIGKILSLSK